MTTLRDVAGTERDLAGWLEVVVAGARHVEVTLHPTPRTTGFSSETLLFTASWGDQVGEYVARVRPVQSLYQEHDLDAQWRVIDAVGRHGGVPVPRIVGADTSETAVLGQPFFVMERVPGSAPPDNPPFTVKGWVADATPAQQQALHRRGLAVLAAIHAVDWRAQGLGFLAASTANPVGVAAALEHDRSFLAWVAGGRSLALFEAALEWMAAHLPEDPADDWVLSWGDARLGNMLFVDFAPTAVLDWEMATLAAPAADLGWWLAFDRLHTEGIRRPRPAGFLSEADAVAWYEAQSGRAVRDLHYYLVRAAFRAGLLLLRYRDGLVAAGTLAADAERGPHTPGVNVLATLLERDTEGHDALAP